MMRSFFTALFFLFSLSVFAIPAPIEFDNIVVDMGSRTYSLEYANTAEQRMRGLMFRERLCDDCGMVFAFSVPRVGSIWMKNTQIPLDLAYVDQDGVITDILPLKPHDLTPVRSSKVVKFAIEMNQGWFAKRKIKVGDRIGVRLKEVKNRN